MVSTLEQMQVQMGHDQVSGGVSVLCWLAASVAMFYGNLQKCKFMDFVLHWVLRTELVYNELKKLGLLSLNILWHCRYTIVKYKSCIYYYSLKFIFKWIKGIFKRIKDIFNWIENFFKSFKYIFKSFEDLFEDILYSCEDIFNSFDDIFKSFEEIFNPYFTISLNNLKIS